MRYIYQYKLGLKITLFFMLLNPIVLYGENHSSDSLGVIDNTVSTQVNPSKMIDLEAVDDQLNTLIKKQYALSKRIVERMTRYSNTIVSTNEPSSIYSARLKGILRYDEKMVAVMSMNEQIILLRLHEAFDDWYVSAIADDMNSVTFTHDVTQMVLVRRLQ